MLKEQAGILRLGSMASARSSMVVCLPGHLVFPGRDLRANIYAAHSIVGRLPRGMEMTKSLRRAQRIEAVLAAASSPSMLR
jgi:hypothetical protein